MSTLKKIFTVVFVLALILGALGGAGYLGFRYLQAKQKDAEKVRYTESQKGDLEVVLKETATLKPRKVVEIKSKVSGRIVKMNFLPGEIVQCASVIAEIDREEYERALEIAEQDLERAEQEWEALLPFGEIVTEPEKIKPQEMETLIDIVLIDFGASKIEYLNTKEMYARDLVSLKSLDDAEQRYDTAYVAYHQKVRAASKTLKGTKVNYDQAIEDLSETTIRAPVVGVVTIVPVEEGELVQGTGNMSPGTSIAEVADLSEMIAVVKLNEVDVTKVKVGDPVTLTVASEEDTEISGEVESIAPSGTPVNNIVTFEVKIALHEQFDYFKPEMTANADILVEKVEDVVKIPLEAINEKKGKKSVTVLAKKAEAPEISIGTPAEAEPSEDEESKKGEDEDETDEEEGRFYKTEFAQKNQYDEETLEIETGLTNELWAEVTRGATEGLTLKLPDLKIERESRGPF